MPWVASQPPAPSARPHHQSRPSTNPPRQCPSRQLFTPLLCQGQISTQPASPPSHASKPPTTLLASDLPLLLTTAWPRRLERSASSARWAARSRTTSYPTMARQTSRADSSTWLIWSATGERRSAAAGKDVQDDGTKKKARWPIRRRRRSGGILREGDGRELKQCNNCGLFLIFIIFLSYLTISGRQHQAACISFVYRFFFSFFFLSFSFLFWNNGSGNQSSSTRGQVTEGRRIFSHDIMTT